MLIIVLIATPSLILPGSAPDSGQIVALVALFGATLTFIEYSSVYPSLVEFRFAPPFNRIRFLSLFLTVFLLSVILRGMESPTTLTEIVTAIGAIIGQAIDFPYSPVRLITLALPENGDPHQVALVRTTAGMSYLISLLTLAVFVIVQRLLAWPSRAGVFNVWVNLPTFDPTAGGDVVERLDRDARVNIALGFLLPFLIPAVLGAAAGGYRLISVDSPQNLIWAMALWAFLPASLFMRGIAMARIAGMIRERRRLSAQGEGLGLQPV